MKLLQKTMALVRPHKAKAGPLPKSQRFAPPLPCRQTPLSGGPYRVGSLCASILSVTRVGLCALCPALPEPHPLGDLAGRIAHAIRMKTLAKSGPSS